MLLILDTPEIERKLESAIESAKDPAILRELDIVKELFHFAIPVVLEAFLSLRCGEFVRHRQSKRDIICLLLRFRGRCEYKKPLLASEFMSFYWMELADIDCVRHLAEKAP